MEHMRGNASNEHNEVSMTANHNELPEEMWAPNSFGRLFRR